MSEPDVEISASVKSSDVISGAAEQVLTLLAQVLDPDVKPGDVVEKFQLLTVR